MVSYRVLRGMPVPELAVMLVGASAIVGELDAPTVSVTL